MLTPLPAVESACSMLQQEESQREILEFAGVESGSSAMYSRQQATQSTQGHERSLICGACGGKGHSQKRCWTVIGYPKWHHKYKTNPASTAAHTSAGNSITLTQEQFAKLLSHYLAANAVF
uniref:CCHC-type domain-containing protein n=1 Tax=Chenopodium quinoa TaxID=63459 RepID=A0A803N311_CHEQI